MAVLLTLNLSCAQPGERHHLNLTTARPFLTLVEIVAAIDFLGVLDGVWDRFLQQPLLLLQMPMPKLSASCAAKFARLLQLALLRQRSAGGPVAAEFLTLVTTSDNYRFRPDDDFELRRRGRPHFLAAIPRSL